MLFLAVRPGIEPGLFCSKNRRVANYTIGQLFQAAKLKIKYYFRYCDDFVIINRDKDFLFDIMEKIKSFLHENLLLDLHPKKVENLYPC